LVVGLVLLGGCSEESSAGLDFDAPAYACTLAEAPAVPLNRKLMIAHRGATYKFPENTTEAVLQASKEKANAVEFDVVLTADGVPILLHDFTLDRTTDCSGDARKKTLAQIRQCNIAGGYKVPVLAELMPQLGAFEKYFVELKTSDDQAEAMAKAVGAIIRDQVDYDRAVVTSYNLLALYNLKTLYPSPRIHSAYDGQDFQVPLATLNLGFDYMLMPLAEISDCMVATANHMGVRLVAYTVSDEATLMAVLTNPRVDYLAGVMFDNIEVLGRNLKTIEKEYGEALESPKDCKHDEGGAWDPREGHCEQRCEPSSCQDFEVCDENSGLCLSGTDSLVAVSALLGQIEQTLEGEFEKGKEEPSEEAVASLLTLFSAASPYAQRADLITQQMSASKRSSFSAFGLQVVALKEVDPDTLQVQTRSGHYWFLNRELGVWRVDYFQQ
jgi:glycerophosphoryl diester phosphodiesterase